MTTEHTPGPWEQFAKLTASENHKGFDVQDVATQHWIATVSPKDQDGNEGKANARLIAAAPDLLAALVEILRHIHEEPADMAYINNTAVNAIAAARGEGS